MIIRQLFAGEGFIQINISHLRLIEEHIDLSSGKIYD